MYEHQVPPTRTWFLAGLLVAQLAEVIAATGVHRAVIQQKRRVFATTAYTTKPLAREEVTGARLHHYLLFNAAQA